MTKKIIIKVKGMHCTSCEFLLETSIKTIENVKKVVASKKLGQVEIEYIHNKPDENAIKNIIMQSGYAVSDINLKDSEFCINNKDNSELWLSKNPRDYVQLVIIGILIYFIYQVLINNGISFGNISQSSSPSLWIVLLIGFTAGVSSCIAVVGGLVLAVSTRWNQIHMNKSVSFRFLPHIYFNIGRVIGFAFFGALLGLFGSFISISNFGFAIMTTLVGLIMLLLGINLTNISPRLSNIFITLPKFLSKGIGDIENKVPSKVAFLSGVMTFFLPCGFTLAMQMYAISTKSIITGALVMGIFAIGTLPGLLGIGGLTSIIKGNIAKLFFRFTGIVVLLLGLFNISNAINLIKSTGIGKQQIVAYSGNSTKLIIQEVKMIQDDNGYSPNNIEINANTKIHLIINSQNPWSCASQFTIPSLGIKKSLQKGDNLIEFIASASGEIPFSCSMGMYTGKFVIKNNEIKLVYNDKGLLPDVINLEKGKEYKIEIDVQTDVYGCMSTIMIPGLDENIQSLKKGSKIIFNVKPDKSGNYEFTCAMGVLHGKIVVK